MALTKISGDVLQQPIDVGIITATSITATTGTFSGNVSIAGTLTYEDVTNIDSIGLVTARSGIHVTGGSVGIGTDNPLDILQVGAASTQAFYVFSDGRVSIGQDNPAGIFAARDNSGTSGSSQIIRAEKKGTSDTSVFRVDIDADTNEIELIGTGAQASNISIRSGSNKVAYFKTDGNVGIGVTDPNEKLEVAANSAHRISVRATDTTMSDTGDYGGFCWYTNDNSNPNRKNWDIYQKASGSTGTTDLHINSFSTNDTVVLDSGGNIGIGTDNIISFEPTLQISGTDPTLLLQDTATVVDYFGVNVTSGIAQLWYDDAADLTINTASGISGSGIAEKVRITSDGKIGIGKTNPQNVLDLGPGTSNRGISWGGTDFNYANIWTEYGSADLHIGQGIRPDGTSSGWVSSYGASSGRTLIKSDYSAGDITFHTAAPSSVADGGAVTVPVRLRITGIGSVGIGVDDPDVALEIAGERIKVNGLTEISESFLLVNNTAYNFDYTVFNEGGYGNSFYIICGYNHYYTAAYGAHRVAFVSTRGTSLDVMIDGGNQSHSQAGAWSFSKPNTTTLRITKSAGNYGGSGYGFIKIFTNQL